MTSRSPVPGCCSADLPPALVRAGEQGPRPEDVLVPGTDPASWPSLETLEQGYVRKVLEAVGGNKTLAARILGLDRKTLYRKLGRAEPPPG